MREITEGHFVGWHFGLPHEKKAYNFKTWQGAQRFLESQRSKEIDGYSLFVGENGNEERQRGYDLQHPVGNPARKINGTWKIQFDLSEQTAA